MKYNKIFSILFSVLCFLPTIELKSQEIVPYRDNDNNKWGFENLTTDEIVVPAAYDDAVEFSDGVGIVKNYGKYGAVDASGNLFLPCKYDELIFYKNDYNNPNVLQSYNDSAYTLFVDYYYISNSGLCIPSNYFPCPKGYDIDSTALTPSLSKIQESIKHIDDCDLDKALNSIREAIDADKSNPWPYYFFSQVLFEGLCANITYDIVKEHIDEIEKYLNTAESLEDKPHFNVMIKDKQDKLYRYYTKNREKKKALQRELRSDKNILCEHTGLFSLIGTNYSNKDIGMELGFGFGLQNPAYREKDETYVASMSMFFAGLSYEHYFESNTGCYKFHLPYLSFQAPIALGIYPTLTTDYKNSALGIRPEIGLHIKRFNLTYGYNFVSKSKFPDRKGAIVSLRYNLYFLSQKSHFYNEPPE